MADLDWTDVRSSNVRRVAFDEDSGELMIEFSGGSVYSYPNQSSATMQDIINSSSPGRYVSQWLRKLPARKVK